MEWLYPELDRDTTWGSAKNILLPKKDNLYKFEGRTYVGFNDGTVIFQDEFGRKNPGNERLLLKKPKKLGRNDYCNCGSGKKYKHCCYSKLEEDRPAWDILSIRERNIILYRGVYGILGLDKGKTWDDVRRELSNEQVVAFYNLYWSLWPLETDMFKLLPKPDNRLRVLYTGLLDPRNIILPLATTPFFDEIIIQHPFIHPKAVTEKFSPLENPHQHKSQTLKNILFFLYIEQFVMSGRVVFIPDPCMFNNYLLRETMHTAETRRCNIPLDEAERKLLMSYGDDDFERMMRSLPIEQQRKRISDILPELSVSETNRLIEYIKAKHEKDPFALMQDDLFDEGGQLTMFSMSPNLEMTLFIAQITGSAILTNSATRWDELVRTQYSSSGIVSYPMKPLTAIINDHQFTLIADPRANLNPLVINRFAPLRASFKQLLSFSMGKLFPPNDSTIKIFSSDFAKGIRSLDGVYGPDGSDLFRARLEFLAPMGGFTSNDVQRLLLKSGSTGHLHNVPICIRIKPTSLVNDT